MIKRPALAMLLVALVGCGGEAGAPSTARLVPEIAASIPSAFVSDLAITAGGVFVVALAEDATIRVLRRDPSGTWDRPHALPAPLSHPYGIVYRAPPAVNEHGELVRVWSQAERAGVERVWAARYDAPGWEDPVPLSAGARWALDAVVALDEEGNATAAWTEAHGDVTSVWTARGTAGGWEAPERLDGGVQPVGIPRVAVAGDGMVTVVWAEGGAVHLRRRARTGAWSDPEVVPGSDDELGPGGDLLVGVEASGDAMIGFTTVFDPAPVLELRATRCHLAGGCDPFVAMTRLGPWYPELSVAGHGALLRWEEPPVDLPDNLDGVVLTERAAIALPGRPWSAPDVLGSVRLPVGLYPDEVVVAQQALVASYAAGGLAITRHSAAGWGSPTYLDFGTVYGVSATSVRLAAGLDERVYAAWSDGKRVYFAPLP